MRRGAIVPWSLKTHDRNPAQALRDPGRSSHQLHPGGALLEELQRLARRQGRSVRALVEAIDAERSGNLSSAIRVYVLNAIRAERDAGGKQDP